MPAGPWFNLQGGVREVLRRGPDRTQLVLGVQGLAPYMFDIDAAAFVSAQGEVTARVELEADQRITQRLILQPRIEANLVGAGHPRNRHRRGVTSIQAGVRLRYEFVREFAPYIGVEWQRDFGRTADYTRTSGGNADRLVGVIGVRMWL